MASSASGLRQPCPPDVYVFDAIRKNLTYEKTGLGSVLKPAPVAQHLPAFDSKGKPCFKPYVGSGKLENKNPRLPNWLIFGRIDILVNNAAEQHKVLRVKDLVAETVERTLRTNVFGLIFRTKLACNHLVAGGVVINTASIAAYRGMDVLVDYSATKGAVVSFTRALSQQLAPRRIRVNAVAPGPVWTPLIPNTFFSGRDPELWLLPSLPLSVQPSLQRWLLRLCFWLRIVLHLLRARLSSPMNERL
ncbi:hypothetical protein CLU79DRAFT_720169 [Phycomyces nitens]|nr:hypothetical protein CLU79DRAFT_720169 [Phycomyces nitens]